MKMSDVIRFTDEEATRQQQQQQQQPAGVMEGPSRDLCDGALEPPEHHRSSSTGSVQSVVESQPQTLKVYLRVRPFSKEELSDHEDQGCVVLENNQVVKLHAPKGSATLKSSERGIGVAVHQFSFSQVFGLETSQSELFEGTVESQVSDYLDGKNALMFSYGVTNAGKTYTIQGTSKEPGILPRVLDTTFRHIGQRQYMGMDLKPYLSTDVQCLDLEQVKQEKNARASIFAYFREDGEQPRVNSISSSCLPSAARLATDAGTEMDGGSTETSDCMFVLWMAAFEIYNESIYDLLQTTPCSKSKRAALRLCEDHSGNAYIRDLKWINIQNLEEANKLLNFGNKNRSAASTKMNHSSSRSHCIFTMKLLKINGTTVERISEFSLCDLAGSERCNKTKTFGARLKEAGNINNSLLILGKCITALRNSNQTKSGYIPFRESKLTKLFQAFFCGRGKASMIVNINQCASTYDETLHVMKFSAIAKQVVQVTPLNSLASPCLVDRDGNPLLSTRTLSEEDLLDEEDEADISILPQEDLLTVIENLRSKLLAERRKNMVQEMEIRKEMGDAMLQQLIESEELLCRQMLEQRESYDEKLENTFDMYKDAIKEHAYQCAQDRIGEDYVPIDEFIAEEEKVEALTCKLSELEKRKTFFRPPTHISMIDQSSQTVDDLPPNDRQADAQSEARFKSVYKEKCALETMCADKQELIMSLEKQLVGLTKTLTTQHKELEVLRRKAEDQTRSIDDLLRENINKDSEIASLKEQVAIHFQKSPVKTKPKRGLLSNIRDTVASPRSAIIGRTLRKTIRATPTPGKKQNG